MTSCNTWKLARKMGAATMFRLVAKFQNKEKVD
jgi:hypothetical protein